jgi:hypothetical protein
MPGKGPEGKADCAASIGGISFSHKSSASFPQSLAATRKKGLNQFQKLAATA